MGSYAGKGNCRCAIALEVCELAEYRTEIPLFIYYLYLLT